MQRFRIGDVIRIPHYPTCGGFRCWKVMAETLGGVKQEGTYNLQCIDVHENETIQVPCIILETHPGIQRI